MKTPSLLFALTICRISLFAQPEGDTLGNIYDDLYKRNKGIIGLHSGRKIEGYLDYNAYTSSLKLISDKGTEYLYAPNDVTHFEYTDETTGVKRTFITCNVTFSNEKENGPRFLEVLHKTNDIMCLNLKLPMVVERRTPDPVRAMNRRAMIGGGALGAPSDYQVNRDRLVMESVDILYFMKQDSLFPYVVRRSKEVEDLSGKSLTGGRKRSSVDVIDRELPEYLMGSKFEAVKKFASKQRLDWTNKEELVQIMEYFAKIK